MNSRGRTQLPETNDFAPGADTPLELVPAEIDARAFRYALLAWFGRRARALPWRQTKNPYAIWISEVMLQQTQVATVIPYFKRFLRAFPTVRHLAQASEEHVLRLWSGLGYYRRARHLQRAARQLWRDGKGEFPRDERALRSLPGIGKYTARAILSIAFKLPYPVLDGNIARVTARLLAGRGDPTAASFRRRLECELNRLLSRRSPGNFNQALMELGQTICLPRAPRCRVCPLQNCCRAGNTPNPEAYPAVRPRRQTETSHLAIAIVSRNGKVALMKGLDEGLLHNLWNFPAAFGNTPKGALSRLRRKLRDASGGAMSTSVPLGSLQHQITYRSIQALLYSFEVENGNRRRPFRWVPLVQLEKYALSQLARKIAVLVRKSEPLSESRNRR